MWHISKVEPFVREASPAQYWSTEMGQVVMKRQSDCWVSGISFSMSSLRLVVQPSVKSWLSEAQWRTGMHYLTKER